MAGDSICKVESDTEVKCEPHKFYEQMKYKLHHLPTIFPQGYTDCQILEGDGESEGSLRLWKYILPGTTEELTVKARTTKQDDENMMIVLYVEEGDLHDHHKHFQVSVQVYPSKEAGSLVKWIIEYEKHHDDVPDPHLYLELFNKLNEMMDIHVDKTSSSSSSSGVCKAISETKVKCNPHKFFEMIKYKLNHLPTIFPEAYKDCQILEGDGESKGSLRLWKYVLPGSSQEMTVKARTTIQDDENMIYALLVEEGDLHDHHKHFQVIIQVYPNEEGGSLVQWTVEYEKHHDDIPDPDTHIELFNKLNEMVDIHAHSTAGNES